MESFATMTVGAWRHGQLNCWNYLYWTSPVTDSSWFLEVNCHPFNSNKTDGRTLMAHRQRQSGHKPHCKDSPNEIQVRYESTKPIKINSWILPLPACAIEFSPPNLLSSTLPCSWGQESNMGIMGIFYSGWSSDVWENFFQHSQRLAHIWHQIKQEPVGTACPNAKSDIRGDHKLHSCLYERVICHLGFWRLVSQTSSNVNDRKRICSNSTAKI